MAAKADRGPFEALLRRVSQLAMSLSQSMLRRQPGPTPPAPQGTSSSSSSSPDCAPTGGEGDKAAGPAWAHLGEPLHGTPAGSQVEQLASQVRRLGLATAQLQRQLQAQASSANADQQPAAKPEGAAGAGEAGAAQLLQRLGEVELQLGGKADQVRGCVQAALSAPGN